MSAVKQSNAQDPYEVAANRAIEDLKNALQRMQSAQIEMSRAGVDVSKLRSLLEELLCQLPEGQRPTLPKEIEDFIATSQPTPHLGSDTYKSVLRIIKQNAVNQNFKAKTVFEEVRRSDNGANRKSVLECLGHLARTGALTRVRRGVYRIPTYGIVVDLQDEEFDALSKSANIENQAAALGKIDS